MFFLVDFTITSGITISGFLLLLSLKNEDKSTSRYFIRPLFFLLLSYFLFYFGVIRELDLLQLIGWVLGGAIGYALGPLIFLYVKAIYQGRYLLKTRFCYHFIPFVLMYVFVIFPVTYKVLNETTKQSSYYKIVDFYLNHLDFIVNIHVLIYMYFTHRFLKQTRHILKENYASLQKIDMHWLRCLIKWVSVLIIIDLFAWILEQSFDFEFLEEGFFIVFVDAVFITYFAFGTINQAVITIPAYLNEMIAEKEKRQEKPEKKLNWETEQIEHIEKMLLEVLNNAHLYRDDTLTLTKLAEKLSISDKRMSDFLNSHLKTNFYELINKYRVEDFIKRLKQNEAENMTLLGLAFDCGFNSKSSFNRIFKQTTGKTPSQYKKEILA